MDEAFYSFEDFKIAPLETYEFYSMNLAKIIKSYFKNRPQLGPNKSSCNF